MQQSKKQGLLVLLITSGLIAVTLWYVLNLSLVHFDSAQSTVLSAANGELLSASIASDGQWRFPPVTQIPEKYKKAVLTYEDRRFYYHLGLDPLAIVRALKTNISHGRIVSGASTLTMQVVRLAQPGKPRTLYQKGIEAFLAIYLEMRLSKDDILKLYASHAPFGGNVVGLDAAAWRYFGRKARDLSWAESAMLAVLPNSPALIHPGRNREALKTKRNTLLLQLHQRGFLDEMTYSLAISEDLPQKPHAMPMYAPHLLGRIRGEQGSPASGRFKTSIDKSYQLRVNKIIAHHMQTFRFNQVYNAAALVIDVPTGQVKSYVGNVPTETMSEHGRYVDIITAPRSTGSILKPLLYAGLLQSGELLPTQLVPDIPTRMGGFAPHNYNRRYLGAVPAWQALARSLNVPAVRMLQSYGVDRFYNLLTNLEITTLFRNADDYGLSLILGGAEATLWELACIYSRMAYELQSGYTLPINTNYAVNYLAGQPSKFREPEVPFPFDHASLWQVFDAMLKVSRPGQENAWQSFSSSHNIAWKTGTSYGHRDAWAVGVTPGFVVAVWVGNADGTGRPGLSGLNYAAPILFDIFKILPLDDWFTRPEMDLQTVTICSNSGFRKGINCSSSKQIFTGNPDKTRACPYCMPVHLDKAMQWRVSADCAETDDIQSMGWFVLPALIEWYYAQNHADYKILPEYRADCKAPESSPLALIYPQENSKIFVPVELDGRLGQALFEATHRMPDMNLFWHIDNQYIGNTRDIHQIALAPNPGIHTLTVVDEAGNYIQRIFEIISRN